MAYQQKMSDSKLTIEYVSVDLDSLEGQSGMDKAFDLLFDEVFRQSTEAVLTTMDN